MEGVKKVVSSVALPKDDYENMMKELTENGVHYVVDKNGKKDEVRLVNGKPVEVSTNREIINMAEIQKLMQEQGNGHFHALTTWGKLMAINAKIIHEMPNREHLILEIPGQPGFVVYDPKLDKVIAKMASFEVPQ